MHFSTQAGPTRWTIDETYHGYNTKYLCGPSHMHLLAPSVCDVLLTPIRALMCLCARSPGKPSNPHGLRNQSFYTSHYMLQVVAHVPPPLDCSGLIQRVSKPRRGISPLVLASGGQQKGI